MLADGFRWSADSDGEWLSIRARGAKQFCESLDPNKKYDVDIKEHREKRSLDANAYCWVLIGKLAAKLRVRQMRYTGSTSKILAAITQLYP